MKKLLLPLILALVAAPTLRAFDHSNFDRILGTYVNGNGMVDYQGLKQHRAALDQYLESTGSVSESSFQSWSQDEQLAFLINVYNAETLQFIVDNYPVESIKKLGGLLSTPWDKKNVALFGDTTTLNKLEHGIIRKQYDEPRIHFALVCAAVGCPPLRTEAYTGARLDSQLDDQARTFLAQSSKNRLEGGTLYLSSIFDWYGGDFKTNGKSVADYVDPYMSGSTSGKKVKFTDYDWSLNEQ